MCDYRQLDTANIVRNFDNEEVKQLLKSIGPVRRKLVLKKIKKYLRNIGLGKENVRKGIIQIMTRPQIVIAKTQTYNPRYEKENHVIENGTEAEGCDFDKILSTKSSHSNSNDNERITLHKEYPLNEPYNIESANVFNNFLSKPVIENAAKSTIQNLQLDLVAPDSTEEIPSIKQNFLCSTISNSNHNELSNNIFNNQKIKKRNSLSEATTPQPYKCAKRFRSKSSDLSTNKKDSKSILSIKLTLIRDKSNQKNWINLENIKTIAGTDKNIGNVRRNECSNEIEENEITPSENICVLPTEIVSEEVPELERYNFENRSIVRNINNFNNCLSPYLRNFVKKRSSSFRDVINMDSDCNSLCKRRKFSDYSTIDMQKNNINNCIDLVKSSLENNLHVKESLLQSKLSNDYSKKLLPKMDPCILNPYNFLNNNDNNKNISIDQNFHANITLSLSSPLKKIVSASLFASNQNEFLDLSQDNYLASGRKYMDSTNEDFSDHNSETGSEVVVPKIIADKSTEFNYNIQVDHNCNIEKGVKKRDKSLCQISNKLDNTIDEEVNSVEGQEYIINKNCQRITSDVLQIKTISEATNESSSTDISLEKKIVTANLELKLLKDDQLNVAPEENQLILQFQKFGKNTDTEFKKSKENIINNSTINVEVNRREEVMTKTDNNHIKVTLLKEYMKQVRSNDTDKELHDNDRSSIILKLNMGKELNEVNKITGETENKLKCNINSLENKNMTINLKKIDVHEMENNTSVIDIETIGMEKNQDRSNTNSPDSQEMCIIDIVDSPLNRDQVLPDSTGLDEHLEGGDFDFATSIKKIKQNSDSDNEYDVDSDCDVEINDQESIEYSINMESRDDNVNLINKMTVETNAPKTDEYRKSKNLIKAKNLQETFNSSSTHCLKKLPNFYNECITKVVNNRTKIDDITNIDISDLNLYISDDIDDIVTVMEHINSNFNSKKEINKVQHKKMTHNISSDLHDKQMNNLTNVALIEKEKKFLSNEQQVGNPVQQLQTKQLEKEKSEGVQIEDMILSLCEQYDKRHILTQTVEDNSILLVNELVSSSSESCKNQTTIISPFDMSSRLTSNKNIKNDSQTNLSTLKNCNKPSTSKSSSSKSSNSQFTIHRQSNGKNKYKVYNKDSLNNKRIVKCSNNFTSDFNNTSNNTNILGEIPKENVFKEATATNPLNVKVSVIYPNTNLQATSNKSLNSDSNENSEIENCIPSKDSSIKELENQVSVIKNTQPMDNISCPIIFEVSIPSAQEQSENDYDLLKNININLVDEIDVIRDTSMTNSSNFNSPEKTFKLRDINELLEKPEKLSGSKKVTFKNKNSTDKCIPPPILLLSDAASSNTPFLPETISDVDENNLSTTNSSDKFKALANLINNISPMPHYSQLQTICCNIEQPILQNSKFNNLSSSSTPVTKKNNSNSNMQLSYQQEYNALPGCSYSASKPGMSQALENVSQNNCTLFNKNSQSTTPVHPSANMNGNNRKVVLASSIYSNFYAQDTVFTLDLPPLQTLAILIPYIVNMQESSDSINKKIIEYKKMLLNKLVYELKALDKIVLHKRKQYINALLNFNTLTENTWKFQLIIITIIQCVFSLTNLTTKVNYHKVIQAIVNSINPKPSNQLLSTLNSILKLYYYFKQKGINCGYSDRRQPLLLELEEMNNKYQPNTINTMTDHQKREFIAQTKIYRKISQIHALQLQVPAGDHNFRDDYQKIDEIDSSLIIPLQQNITNNSIEIINSLQNSSLKNKTQLSSISNKMIEGHQDKSNNFLISSNPISSLSNDAANTSNKKSKNEAINETFPGEKEYNINHLCLKCRKLSQIVCSNCKIATYCSRDCQQNHWKEKHYKICKKI